MIIDSQKQFVELTIDAIMCGKVKYDLDFFASSNRPKDFHNANQLISDWMVERKNQESAKFIELTHELFIQFVTSRSAQVLLGEIQDNGLEKELESLHNENNLMKEELQELTAKHIKAEGENKKLHDENLMLANELNDLKNIVNSYEKASLGK